MPKNIGAIPQFFVLMSVLPIVSCYDAVPASECGSLVFVVITITILLGAHLCKSTRGQRELEAVFNRDYVQIGALRIHFLVPENHSPEDAQQLQQPIGRSIHRYSQEYLYHSTRNSIPTNEIDGHGTDGDRQDEGGRRGRDGNDNGRNGGGAPLESFNHRRREVWEDGSSAGRGSLRRNAGRTAALFLGSKRTFADSTWTRAEIIRGFSKTEGLLRAHFKIPNIYTKLISSSKEVPAGWKLRRRSIVVNGLYATTRLLNRLVVEQGEKTIKDVICMFPREDDVHSSHMRFFNVEPEEQPTTFGPESWIILSTRKINKAHLGTPGELEEIFGPVNTVFPAWSHLALETWTQIFDESLNVDVYVICAQDESEEKEEDAFEVDSLISWNPSQEVAAEVVNAPRQQQQQQPLPAVVAPAGDLLPRRRASIVDIGAGAAEEQRGQDAVPVRN